MHNIQLGITNTYCNMKANLLVPNGHYKYYPKQVEKYVTLKRWETMRY